jgi:predicted PurR-regulated permease PerM
VIPLPGSTATRLGFNLLALLGVVVALRLGATVFIPTVIALLLAAVLGPAAYWLHHRLHFHWFTACVTVIALLLAVNLLITLVFAQTITQMLQVLPQQDERSQLAFYTKFRTQLVKISPVQLDEKMFPPNPKHSSEIGAFQVVTKAVAESAPNALLVVVAYGLLYLWQWILILFILLFLLLEGRTLTRRVVEIFGPSAEVQAKAGQVLLDMAQQVRTYLVWRTILNFGLALVVGTVYHLAGLHQPWTWAILLAILKYIPYLGPIIAGVPPVVDAFFSTSAWGALGILIFYTAAAVIEGYFILPLVMGRSMRMYATTVMLACLFWELVWGPLGLFLAMPLIAALKAICYHVPGWRPWANLMGPTEPDLPSKTPPKEPAVIEEEPEAVSTDTVIHVLPLASQRKSGE